MREQAFAIRDLPVPPLDPPAAPTLLPIRDVSAISFQGSVGARTYVVERASQAAGPWTVCAAAVDECFTQYRPQWSDETATRGDWFYRVRARNDAGVSAPSNVVGPVRVTHLTLVDELADLSKVATHRRRVGDQVARLPFGDGGRPPRMVGRRAVSSFIVCRRRSAAPGCLCSFRRKWST